MQTNYKYQLNFNLIYGLLPVKRVVRQNWTLTFLSDLLPFTTMDRAWNAHSAAYHIRKLLAAHALKSERDAHGKLTQKVYTMQSPISLPPQVSGAPSTSYVDIHIQVRADNEELIQKILECISKNRIE